jgi:16S rRNA (uracil1498-N3)-methyltransferase
MARFFMAGTNLLGGTAIIKGRDAEHIRVLRMKPGERIIICDGKGTDYICHLVRSGDKEAEAEVVEIVACQAEPDVNVSVFAGLPKGDRADFIIQKCTEAGASRISFFDCERCIVKPKSEGLSGKLARWQRIAQSAAQQSGRGIIPEVRYISNYVDMLDASMKTDATFFLYEAGEDRLPLKDAIEQAGNCKSISIISGPEGGFSEAEAKMARGVGFYICSMGERILRCETAPLVALTAIMYATGNMD